MAKNAISKIIVGILFYHPDSFPIKATIPIPIPSSQIVGGQ